MFELEPDLDGTPLAGMLDAEITRLLARKHNLNERHIEDRVIRVMDRMGVLYEQSTLGVSNQHRLLPGVHQAVEAAARQGWDTALLTGNAREVARLKLERAGLHSLEITGAFGDSARDRGHLVEAAWREIEAARGHRYPSDRTVLVGDTPRDIAAARHANTKVVAVATGRFDMATLRDLEPDGLLENLADTDAFVEAIRQALNSSSGQN